LEYAESVRKYISHIRAVQKLTKWHHFFKMHFSRDYISKYALFGEKDTQTATQ